MRKSFKLLISVLLVFAVLGPLCAQEAVLPSGGDASSNSGSVSYSVGQVAFISISSDSGRVSQGVQQALEIFSLTDIDPRWGDLAISIFPNPVVEQVNLKASGNLPRNLSYHLVDINGKRMLSGKLEQNLQAISLKHISAGTYVLQLTSQRKPVQSFKIIKNN